eukprot:4637077-Pyramimonas_sp.AAC.1
MARSGPVEPCVTSEPVPSPFRSRRLSQVSRPASPRTPLSFFASPGVLLNSQPLHRDNGRALEQARPRHRHRPRPLLRREH